MSMVKLTNLVKRFEQKIAVDNMSLTIEEGEIFGLLGPNGAGKSTLINMLCGLLKNDSGEIAVDGLNLKTHPLEVKKRIGLVPQDIAIFNNLSAWENVEFFAKLAGLRGSFLRNRVAEALEFTGLTEHSKSFPKGFSGGMKRRLNIACAIAHHPKLIIMDEPTVGIDPQSRNHILESVKQLNKMGSTILYTSHYMEEVESICTRIGIIDHGRLIANGTSAELKHLVSEQEKILIDVMDINYNSLEEIKALHGVKAATLLETRLEVLTSQAQTILQDVLFVLSKNSVKVSAIALVQPDLETVFLSLTGRKLRD